MGCEGLVKAMEEHGTIEVEHLYDDYANVVVGPCGDMEAVALGYVHTEDVTVRMDLTEDEPITQRRWLAYDVTDMPEPGSAVGRVNAGYPTEAEAIVALVREHEDDLESQGFWTGCDFRGEPWDREEIDACPYIGDDDYAKCVRLGQDGTLPTEEDVRQAISGLMRDRHPEATRRATVAGEELAKRLSEFMPSMSQYGIAPTVSIHASVSVDSYGDTRFYCGDPFQAISLGIHYAIYDNAAECDGHKSMLLRGLLELDVYEPSGMADDDLQHIVWVASVGGKWCATPSIPELGLFIESDSSEITEDRDIRSAVDNAFYRLASVTATSLLDRKGV